MTDITIKQLYDEIIRNRTEIKSKVEATEVRLLLKIEELTNKLKLVETENCVLRNQVETLERANKTNNIIIFGLNQKTTEVTSGYICQKLKDLLDVDIIEADFNDFYTLGNAEDSPIKVEFISHLKKRIVTKNWHKLKGTDINIVHDLTVQQREQNKLLRKHLNLAKQDKNKTSYIKRNKLYINKKTYTVDDLLELENQEEFEYQTNSAPATPTPINKSIHEIVQIEEKEDTMDKNTKTPKTGTIKRTDTKISERIRKRSAK